MNNIIEKLQGEKKLLAKEFARLLKDNQDPKVYFKKKKYDEYFEKYCSQHKAVFEHITECWEEISKLDGDDIVSNQSDLLYKLAYSMSEAARVDVEALKGLKKGSRQGELNLFIVTSVFPCTLKLGKVYGEELCKEIVNEWGKAFPGTELGYADFDKLKSGFRSFWGFFTGR